MKLEEAIKYAVSKEGVEILQMPQLVNYLADLQAYEIPAIRRIIETFVINQYGYQLLDKLQFGNYELKVIDIETRMVNYEGFQQGMVHYVLNCISYALGKTQIEPNFQVVSKQRTLQKNNYANIPQQEKSSCDTAVSFEPLKGEYKEQLSTGGDLIVSAYSWYIQYYFSGPDARYNGTFKRIDGKEIDNYIKAWLENFKKYKELKRLLPSGGDSIYPGDMGMSIRFGFFEGVCLISYHMPIKDESKLEQVIDDYKEAKIKAIQIQQILRGDKSEVK